MNVLHGNLEPVKGANLWNLNLGHKMHHQVFVHDSIAGGKKGEDVRNEVALVVAQLVPMGQIATQINLCRRPKARHLLLVHFPNFLVLDGEKNKAMRIRLQQRLLGGSAANLLLLLQLCQLGGRNGTL